MIYGGSKYNQELKGGKFNSVLAELGRKGKLVKLPGSKVDKYASDLELRVPEAAFDDAHIVALVAISKCRVVCTRDKAALPYLKRRDLYPKGVKPPKIYQQSGNIKLCCEKHVVDACR